MFPFLQYFACHFVYTKYGSVILGNISAMTQRLKELFHHTKSAEIIWHIKLKINFSLKICHTYTLQYDPAISMRRVECLANVLLLSSSWLILFDILQNYCKVVVILVYTGDLFLQCLKLCCVTPWKITRN